MQQAKKQYHLVAFFSHGDFRASPQWTRFQKYCMADMRLFSREFSAFESDLIYDTVLRYEAPVELHAF